MKSTFFSAVPLLATIASAAPVEVRQATNIDTTVLQFALTLEHLENVFYKNALTNFTQRDFEKAGYSKDYYNNLKYIAHDEEQHVLLLSGALQNAGVTPNAACAYSFPYTDVKSFITLSSVLEGVGTSAYLGGAPLITSKAYLTVAGSILVTEALHTSLQRLAVGEVPMANPYGTPLDPTSVYTLAASFILNCPTSNTALPFTPYPALTYTGNACTLEEPSGKISDLIKRNGWGKWGNGHQGQNQCRAISGGSTASFTAASAVPAGSYLTFVSGLSVTSVKGTINGNTISAPIPTVDEGQTYLFVSSKDVEGALDGTSVLFGPSIIEVAPQPPTINYSVQ
ncbi:hypothetical protein B0A48_13220 [Cryoendolithus antarcticus]|uniref:Ferritin-like domain-containing protein n=1 Tax=Cryoendolithus antarcticus TaxID=1507870 RepID=A0A1V8SNP5_9PEZI|nr:hypothetical protein B0A48_13220 [Cryoendolithus antarcticus]